MPIYQYMYFVSRCLGIISQVTMNLTILDPMDFSQSKWFRTATQASTFTYSGI